MKKLRYVDTDIYIGISIFIVLNFQNSEKRRSLLLELDFLLDFLNKFAQIIIITKMH